MWAFTLYISNKLQGNLMKTVGLIAVACGFALAVFALTMDVSVHIEAKDYGYGIQTHAMDVANIDKMAQRQNLLIFSGVLAIVGAILVGFGAARSTAQVFDALPADPLPELEQVERPVQTPGSVTICPSCRHMGSGDASECARCGAALA
jgi:hypothetical protein